MARELAAEKTAMANSNRIVEEEAVLRMDQRGRLRNAEARLAWIESVLDSAANGIIVTDDAGRIQFLNPAAEDLTGWSAAEALSQPLHVIVPLRDLSTSVAVNDLVTHVIRTGAATPIPTGLHAISRNIFAIDGEIGPRFDRTGVRGCVLTFRDISDRLEADEALPESIPAGMKYMPMTTEDAEPANHLRFVN